MPELEGGLPKPLQEFTLQELKTLLALTDDAVFDCAKDLTMLQKRYTLLSDEIKRRGSEK